MDQFVVRGISAADAAANRHRELLIHDEQRYQMSLDRQAAVIEKRLPGRPRKLSNFGPSPGRNPAASPSTPPPLSRTGKAPGKAPARPAGKPLPSMSLPMEDSPLVTEPAAVLNIASMTAEELMSAALQLLASTRSAPAAMKPAVAKAGPALRKRGRPLGSKNKPKPAAIGPASATPQRKQVRLRITSSSASSDSCDLNSTDNVSSDSSSSSSGSEGEAGQAGAKAGAAKAGAATRVATLPPGRSREVGTAGAKAGLTRQARVATRLASLSRGEAAGRTQPAGQGGVLALAKAAAWVAAGARKFECSEADDEICRHCQQRQEDHDFMSEVQCPM
ncbi:hypothetical protein QJQ45_004605 [Haematococcus lacustris]|nr:hypothetical protein QJQ45_004605 [Haematococcus lacustris]